MNASSNSAEQELSRIPLLMFSNLPVRGGAEEHMLMLLRHLDRRYFELHVACGPEVAQSLRSDLPKDVALFVVKFTRFSDLAGAYQLWRILRGRRIGILHSHMFWSSMFASPVACIAQVPVVIETPHVREQWRRGWKAQYGIDRMVSHCVDQYIAVSHANGRYLSEEKKISRKKITVIQNGCDIARFSPTHLPPAGMRAGLEISSSDPVLLVAARLHEQKGHRVLLDAMPEILREFPRTRVIFAGEGPSRATLEGQVATLGIRGSVQMVGQQTNVADWFALADLVVLPSFYEGLPLVAMEAMAAGKPVLATAVDGTPEVVLNEQTGLLVPPGDPQRLAHAICRLLGNCELRQSLAMAGYDYVRRNFTHEHQVRQTEKLYLSAWRKATGLTVSVNEPEVEKVAVGVN